MTLTPDYEMEERSIFYREGVTRAEIENIVRHRYLRLPASKGKNVGQALFSNGAARGGFTGKEKHRSNNRSSHKRWKGSSSSKPQAPTQDSPSAFDKVRGICIQCLEPGHHWNQCKARTPPASELASGGGAQGQNNGGETVLSCEVHAWYQ